MSSREVTRPIHTGRGEADRRALLQCLPAYSRSLLKIQVPVTVTLAKSRQPIRNIVDLVPGSILQFNKTCDETLTLEVGNQPVAEGETVKVGDKFGIRVTSMVLPDERFFPVTGPRNSDQPQSR